MLDILSGINTLHDLAGKTEIKYGTVKPTAISDFFDSQDEPPLATMRHHMNAYDTSVKNASEGIEKVRRSFDGWWLYYYSGCSVKTNSDLTVHMSANVESLSHSFAKLYSVGHRWNQLHIEIN